MDCVYFPDIYSISSVTHRTIDVFATISESLEVNFNSETADFPREQIKSVMHKMMAYRQNTEFPEINKLFYLLTEMVLGVVGAHETASNSRTKKSVAGRIQNKFVKLISLSDSILPIPTFDQIKTEEYQTQIDEMQNLRSAHTYLYKDLQRQQEMCWIANSKVQKYELCLKTAKLSRNHLADKLSSKHLKARDDSITQLQTTLNYKIQKAEDSNQRYQTLLTKEKVTRNALKLLERDLLDDIRFNLTDRIHSGLLSMKYILTTQTNILYEVLPHVDDFDCRLAAESIIEKLSSKYQFSSPQEFQAANGFKVKLPDIQYVNYKFDMQITKEQPSELTNEQRNNNNTNCQDNQFNFVSNTYVKTKDLSKKTNECLVKIKEGMIVKLKVATDESEVAFGWYKTNPWSQKRWGFFCKSTENLN
ncbi:Hypothetical predicted protein [Mytilus galloprovincialis]|uniref:Uncharacterized protein n=1 Tax=Mytilus galloprovincialis TaxID=29158 RepID=A0A8B6BJA3_MYTGA|nr:Hypothetical predicted protein [Mytilus galloprovincialis]